MRNVLILLRLWGGSLWEYVLRERNRAMNYETYFDWDMDIRPIDEKTFVAVIDMYTGKPRTRFHASVRFTWRSSGCPMPDPYSVFVLRDFLCDQLDGNWWLDEECVYDYSGRVTLE